MPHLLKAAIGRVHSSADNSKLAARNLLAQQIVFGELCPFVEPAQFLKFFPIEQHEHAGGERLVQARQVLEAVVARVQRLVGPGALAANNVGGHAMQLLLLRQLDRAPNH